jgi:hypothetical protein
MAQARRGVRRESLRRVRESLRVSRGSHGGSRSPQGGGVTITRRPDLDAAEPNSTAGSQPAQRVRGETDSRAMETQGQVEARGRRSSASYADGVKNALSILDGLKAQLQRKAGGAGHASPTVASASRSQQTRLQRQDCASGQRQRSISNNSDARRRRGEETAVFHDPQEWEDGEKAEVGDDDVAGSSDRRRAHRGDAAHRHRTSPPRTAAHEPGMRTGKGGQKRPATSHADDAEDTENMTLAELYQASIGKENWSRPKQTAAVVRPANKYTVVEGDNIAFDVDSNDDGGDDDVDNRHLTSSPPVGIAARRKMERQHSRPAVERALYSLNSNSHSPSASAERRSRSRRA